MGVQGLRKFIEATGCCSSVADQVNSGAHRARIVSHVVVDLNGIIHSVYSREHTTPRQTIVATLQRLEVLLRSVVTPRSYLVIAVDGPPPVAKLLTQRARRRKVRHMDLANNLQFSDLSITVGSVFLLELEQALARFFQAAREEGWLRATHITIAGSSVVGEGEHKLAHVLRLVSMDADTYTPSDSVVIVGNDIDLVLTAMGATAFTSISVLSPTSLQNVDVGGILSKWVSGDGGGFAKTSRELAIARLDFVFIFLLNGGDHFGGLGDAAAGLWRRYKQLRLSSGNRFGLFDPLGKALQLPKLSELLGCEAAKDAPVLEGGEAGDKGSAGKAVPDTPGMQLLRGAYWSFNATVKGSIADYHYAPGDSSLVTMPMLRHAVMAWPHPTMEEKDRAKRPLTPLQGFAAVMPILEMLPEGYQTVARQRPELWKALADARSATAVVDAVRELTRRVNMDELTPAEKFLTQFGDPVDVAGNLAGFWTQKTGSPANVQNELGAFVNPLAAPPAGGARPAGHSHGNNAGPRGKRGRAENETLHHAVRREMSRRA